MEFQSLIKAFQSTLTGFKFIEPVSFSEGFAQARFHKKYQVPDPTVTERLAQECWDRFRQVDDQLPNSLTLSERAGWYVARDFLHRALGRPHLDVIDFPQGSEFYPTRGQNSIEARLAKSRWVCTYENFDLWANIAYRHAGIKRASRKRWRRKLVRIAKDNNYNISPDELDRRYKRLCYRKLIGNGLVDHKTVGKEVFTCILYHLTEFTVGSRFATVPKNNSKRRPINVEGFCNFLSQRAIGNWLRGEILRLFGIDLNVAQATHRQLISDINRWATIDLADASDSVSLALCKFLLPARLLNVIMKARSPYIMGPDGEWYYQRKVSSMGNGFTFELMTLILLSLGRTLDDKCSVFGDDIIIKPQVASTLISRLEAVGFTVNSEKSFISGPFRESCGANYYDGEGYIESYDILFPETIGDCVMTWNKVARLANVYPSFNLLRQALWRVLPKALHGGPDPSFTSLGLLSLIGRGGNPTRPPWEPNQGGNLPPDVGFPPVFVTDSVASTSRNIADRKSVV